MVAKKLIDGRVYRLYGVRRTKREASSLAKKLRKEGKLARVIPRVGGGYHIWHYYGKWVGA